MATKDLRGMRFGRLTAVRYLRRDGQRTLWEFRCDCGGHKVAHAADVKRDKVRSCGCLRRYSNAERSWKHGGSGSPEHTAWRAMRERVKPGFHGRKNYYEKGVVICDRWNDFAHFLADVGSRPSPMHSVDRINNDGNYEPGNVRRATQPEQMRNTSRNRWLELDGERMVLADWASRVGLSVPGLRRRLRLWPLERALTERPRPRELERREGLRA